MTSRPARAATGTRAAPKGRVARPSREYATSISAASNVGLVLCAPRVRLVVEHQPPSVSVPLQPEAVRAREARGQVVGRNRRVAEPKWCLVTEPEHRRPRQAQHFAVGQRLDRREVREVHALLLPEEHRETQPPGTSTADSCRSASCRNREPALVSESNCSDSVSLATRGPSSSSGSSPSDSSPSAHPLPARRRPCPPSSSSLSSADSDSPSASSADSEARRSGNRPSSGGRAIAATTGRRSPRWEPARLRTSPACRQPREPAQPDRHGRVPPDAAGVRARFAPLFLAAIRFVLVDGGLRPQVERPASDGAGQPEIESSVGGVRRLAATGAASRRAYRRAAEGRASIAPTRTRVLDADPLAASSSR